MLERLICALALLCLAPAFIACGGTEDDDAFVESPETQHLYITAADLTDDPFVIDVSAGAVRVEFDQTRGRIDLSRVELLTPDGDQIALEDWLTGAERDVDFDDSTQFIVEFPGAMALSGSTPLGERPNALTERSGPPCGGADSCYEIIYIRDANGNVIGWVLVRWVRVR